MTQKLSDLARNNIAEAIELAYNGQTLSAGSGSGGSVTGTAAAPQLWFHSGAAPASCSAARTGTQVLDMNLPGDALAASSGGVKAKAGTWSASTLTAAVLGYFSVMDNAGTTCHHQGLLSQAWAQSTAYVLNQQVHVGSLVYKCTTAGTSAGSGSGPSGTGTGITDGTAVWDYLGPKGMGVDNSNPGNGVLVTVTTFNLTAPNA